MTLRRDPSQWQNPYDRMSEDEREQERRELDEWRERSEPSPSWFLPQDDPDRDDEGQGHICEHPENESGMEWRDPTYCPLLAL